MKPLVAVEVEFPGDLFLSQCGTDGIQNQGNRLLTGFVSDDAVVKQVADDREIQKPLLCGYVRNVCYPFAVRAFRFEVSVQQISITVYGCP